MSARKGPPAVFDGLPQTSGPRILDFKQLFAALDDATLCLPCADQTDDADTIAVGMRLQAVRLEALRLYHQVMADRTTRRSRRRPPP